LSEYYGISGLLFISKSHEGIQTHPDGAAFVPSQGSELGVWDLIDRHVANQFL